MGSGGRGSRRGTSSSATGRSEGRLLFFEPPPPKERKTTVKKEKRTKKKKKTSCGKRRVEEGGRTNRNESCELLVGWCKWAVGYLFCVCSVGDCVKKRKRKKRNDEKKKRQLTERKTFLWTEKSNSNQNYREGGLCYRGPLFYLYSFYANILANLSSYCSIFACCMLALR